MIAVAQPEPTRLAGFRTQVMLAMMVLVFAVVAVALYFAQRNLAANVESSLEKDFHGELAVLHNLQELRRVALVERCRALVRKSRIHAALEDGGIDLLYPSAEDELRDVMQPAGAGSEDPHAPSLHAQFYRFLNEKGAVIVPPNPALVGFLNPEEEKQLALPRVPQDPQIGYIARASDLNGSDVAEVIATPIVSTETGEVIAVLVLGFKPFEFGRNMASGIQTGLWLNGRLHLTGAAEPQSPALGLTISRLFANHSEGETSQRVASGASPLLIFSKQLNPGSIFPPAAEVCIFPLSNLETQQRKLRWQVIGLGGIFLFAAFGASRVLAARLSAPVEKLAIAAEENRSQRVRAEAALETASEELQRSVRFSADASHQLKTPVTVLRAGLEELLTRQHLSVEECHELSGLIHQTYRLTSLIDDLLLLSRMDAGRLKLKLVPVNLTQLIEASCDDLSALPDELNLSVETAVPDALFISGEKRYTAIILQNLLENARKYNHRGGRIRISAQNESGEVKLIIGNSGHPISRETQEHIFERFHRGPIGENVPGYGLGLNLARELARLHGGDLWLTRSDKNWTEFMVCFCGPLRDEITSGESE